MDEFKFNAPKAIKSTNEKIDITFDDVIPQGGSLEILISQQIKNIDLNPLEKNNKQNNNLNISNSQIHNTSTYNISVNNSIIKTSNKSETEKINNPLKKEEVFYSNNQKYNKKEEVEYGKKSHLEFIKLMDQNKYPIGNQLSKDGKFRLITVKEIEEHNSNGSLWTVLNRNVYDLTTYLDYHPGGEKKLMMAAGQDYKYHNWVNYKMLIGKLQIGILQIDN